MQYSNKDYNPEKHDRWRALTVKQPYANDLVTEAYKDENGIVYGINSKVDLNVFNGNRWSLKRLTLD